MAILTSVLERRRALWLAALQRLSPVAPADRDAQVTRSQALLLLRCGEEVLDELCESGLPHRGVPPEECYDRCDLTNLALASHSNRSLPELGATFIARIAAATPQDWVGAHDWSLQARAFALHGPECAEDPAWRFRRPTGEHLGGSCEEWERESPPADAEEAHEWPDASPALRLSGRISTSGEVRTVRSRALRALFAEVLETMEFRSLPPRIERDPYAIIALAAANCVGLSVLLEHECQRAGYQASAQRGYLLGLFGSGEHSWLEVWDDDAKIKILDPALPMVARRAPRPTPAFTAFCQGSISNRLLSFACPVGEQIIEHRCGGRLVPSHAVLNAQPAQAASDPQ